MTDQLNLLLQAIESTDWPTARSASEALAAYGDASLPGLLPLLTSLSATTRHAVALALREIADERSVKPLLDAIRDPVTTGTRGGLVWALQTHTCEDHFLFLFNLALTDTYEVQNHVLTIISEQEFWYELEDLDMAQIQLDLYARCQHRDQGTDLLINELQILLTDLRHQAA